MHTRAPSAVAVVPALLGLTALIHLLPVPGLFGAGMLARLYGIDMHDPGLLLLLRHRALLFALLAVALLIAAWRPRWRPPAIGLGLASCAGFLLLAGDPRALDAALVRVWIADVIALSALAAAAMLERRATAGARR